MTLAVLIGAHCFSRMYLGNVHEFGGWLSSQGVPFGVGAAWAVTIVEAIGTICVASGRFIRFAVPAHIAILVAGIVMVHGREGWFVVGGGRNGVEFSVLLIMGFVTIFLVDRANRAAQK